MSGLHSLLTLVERKSNTICGSMGRRRKRSNSDNDESLEQSRNHSQFYRRPSVIDNDDSAVGETSSKKKAKMSLEKAAVDSSTSKDSHESLTKSDVTEKEKQKIERLQKKKQQRQAKAAAKKLANEETTAQQSQTLSSKTASNEKASTHQKHNLNIEFETLAKGVQYSDVLIGKGPSVQETNKIRVAYTLRSKHRFGKVLDSSNDFKFRIGRGEVVKGWDIGIIGMRQGGKRYLIVPPDAGYGGRDVGAGRGGLLFFEVTLLEC